MLVFSSVCGYLFFCFIKKSPKNPRMELYFYAVKDGESAFFFFGVQMNGSNDCFYIGPYAFENCTSLESVTIPSSMTYIGLRAFKDTGLQTAYFAEADGWKKFRLSGNNLINPISVDPSALSDPAQAAAELKDFPDTGFGTAYVWQR